MHKAVAYWAIPPIDTALRAYRESDCAAQCPSTPGVSAVRGLRLFLVLPLLFSALEHGVVGQGPAV